MDLGMHKPKSGTKKMVESARKRQPGRPHYVPEWAESCEFEDQAELVKKLGADKSVVSRWYGGATPSPDWQDKLAAAFGHPGEPDIIFQHPDSVWFKRFFRGRSDDEIGRMKKLLEDVFPTTKSKG